MTIGTPICSRRLEHLDRAKLTDLTSQLAKALVHLIAAWNIADRSNSPGIVKTMVTLLGIHSVEPREFEPLILGQLGHHAGSALISQMALAEADDE